MVGRTLSAYTVDRVQNRTLDVTYTVYNQQADAVSGVLLTTTLQPGVTFQSATQPPDRGGQELAWSLGALPAYGRASVTLTVTLSATIPLQIDGGAHAFGTLNAGRVTDDAPAAALVNRVIADDLLASTPDANTADPFVQEQAAKLDYDPQRILNYLATEVGYESYTGSLRGARGTLWSVAGNSLDEASLGVALFRASGIPARYAHGTLSDALSRQLILSMFPPGFQTVGYIPAGTPTADPANNPQLLAETRDHYWLQVDTGGGFVDADTSGLPGGGFGTAFTSPAETFATVADGLRHKVRVSLDAEMYNAAVAAFGIDNPLGTTTVLDRTFNAVDLVGRPLTVGHFVNPSSLNSALAASITTYTPYFEIGDAAGTVDDDLIVTGRDYQEIFTNFPLGSQVLTGLTLRVRLTPPGGPAETYERTLLDRIGFATRQNGGAAPAFSPGAAPAIDPADVYTLRIDSARQPDSVLATQIAQLRDIKAEAVGVAAALAAVAPGSTQPADRLLLQQAQRLVQQGNVAYTSLAGTLFMAAADTLSREVADIDLVKAYFDSPRVIMVSATARADTAAGTVSRAVEIDLRKETIRAVAFPGQATEAARIYNAQRGLFESLVEQHVFTTLPPNPAGSSTTAVPVGAPAVFMAAVAQGVPVVRLEAAAASTTAVDALAVSAEAKARITQALLAGRSVSVPASSVVIDGRPRIAWYEQDPATGYAVGVSESGGHFGVVEWTAVTILVAGAATLAFVLSVPDVPQVTLPHNTEADLYGSLLNVATTAALVLKYVVKLSPDLNHTGPPPKDPPIGTMLYSADVPSFRPPSAVVRDVAVTATAAAGAVGGTLQAGSVQLIGDAAASWSTSSTSGFLARSLQAPVATVRTAAGVLVGTGVVAVAAARGASVAVSGSQTVDLRGRGSLTLYGAAGGTLAASGQWDTYTATITGGPTATLTTDGLTLDGQPLPAGTYTIEAGSLTLTGQGPTAAPNVSGSAAVTVTNGTVRVGAGGGTLSVGGAALDAGTGTTLTGYTGTVTVGAGGGATTDPVTLGGTAGHVLRVTTPTAAVAADQNTPATFPVSIATSFADTFAVFAEAPPGWAVAVDAAGVVTVTPAPGTPAGTYAVRVVARSAARPDLVAQATVDVTVTAVTLPDFTLAVVPDPVFTVPYSGAQVPSAFRAAVRNLGPDADTFTLSSADVPAGFTLLDTGAAVTVPAGKTGIVGLYLQPVAGSILPAPGTVLTFDVTATSTTDPALTRTVTVTFVMPEVHAVTLTGTPTALGTIPGQPVNGTLTLTAAGNVTETVTLTATTTAGLGVSGLPPAVTLNPGQTVTLPYTLTPDAATPFNTTLELAVATDLGPNTPPEADQRLSIPVRIAVPGADAIATAAAAATDAGRPELAARLGDLGVALTNLFQTPGAPVFRGQALAALDAVRGLLAADEFFAPAVFDLGIDRDVLAAAATPQETRDAIARVGATLDGVGTLLADAAAHGFTLALAANTAVAQPMTASVFRILLRNVGTETTTYDLSVDGLPAGVMGAFSPTSVTLAPGESTFTAGRPDLFLTLTPTSMTELAAFGFTVRAVARGTPSVTRAVDGSLAARAELVSVVAVTTAPTFTNPGGVVAVSARILNAVNREQAATVRYVVKNSGGTEVFTSASVPTTLTVLTNLSTVALGTLDTTGFAPGDYTITVTVSDAAGVPIPGATGTGQLLVGSPVTATLGVTPDTLPAGTGTVTATLQVDARTPFASLLTPVGTVTIPGANRVATRGNLAYVSGTGGLRVVDISNPAAPVVVGTFGAADIPAGQSVSGVIVDDDRLVVTTNNYNEVAAGAVLVYSLAVPAAPVLAGQAALNPFNGVSYLNAEATSVIDHRVYTFTLTFRYFLGSNDVFAQFGESLVIDVSDPANPAVVDVLFNRPPEPGFTYPDGNRFPDGVSNVWQSAGAGNQTVLIGTTSATKDVVDGVGQILVVDASTPNDPAVVRTLDVPGMSVVTGIAVDGNSALVTGSSRGWRSGQPGPLGLNGKVVVARLDLTDPRNPVVVSTKTFDTDSIGMHFLESLGNGLYAASSVAGPGFAPRVLVFDATDPDDVLLTPVAVPRALGADSLAAAGGLLLTGDGTNLTVYEVGTPESTPATARVTVPTGTGVAVVPGSFNLAPTRTTSGPASVTYEWDLRFFAGQTGQTITWQETVTDVQPGRSVTVIAGGDVSFDSGGTTADFPLAPQSVVGGQVVGLTPPTRTAGPGSAAGYTVRVINPTAAPVEYALSVTGVPAEWVDMITSIVVPANGLIDVPLTLTSDLFTAAGGYGFTVSVAGDNGAASSVGGELVVQGVAAVDPEAHGVVVELTPTTATAGRGTPAAYRVRVTNTGSATETFDLTVALPAGLTGVFSPAAVTVPAGAGNFREVVLVLTPAAGFAPDTVPFTVTATGRTTADAATATGSLEVSTRGVTVALDHSTGAPGDTFQATITNTGTVADTFALAAAGPAGLVAALGQATVTLAPGASAVVTLTTAAAGFAVPGALPLTVIAQSTTAPAVVASAAATLTVGATTGLEAAFSPGVKVLPVPGSTDFLLVFENTGNTEDAYELEITGTTGPVSAMLVGPDVAAARSIPTVRLPGLASGAVVLRASLAGAAAGTVTVAVRSKADASRAASVTAAVSAPAAPVGLPTPGVSVTSDRPVVSAGEAVTFTATVASLPGLSVPTGSVTFRDGTATLGTAPLVNGVATLTARGLTAGPHAITAAYSGDAAYAATASVALAQTVLASRAGRGQIFAVGAGPGGGPRVQVYDAATGLKRLDFFAYDGELRSGVAVATGDVNGDGVQDVITGVGNGGGANVKVFDGETGKLLASWFAYDPAFRGGVWVAAGDLDGDGVAEVVTGPGAGGGPVVEVWSLAGGTPVMTRSFLAYDAAFRGGVTVAAGVGADGRAVLTVGAGPGGGPRVRSFDAATLTILSDVFAFAPEFQGGVYVAAGDILGTGRGTQVLVGPGEGGGPRFRVLGNDGADLGNGFAALASLRNGLTVAALDRATGPAGVLIGAGIGAFEGIMTGGVLTGLDRVGFFGDGFDGGVFVG